MKIKFANKDWLGSFENYHVSRKLKTGIIVGMLLVSGLAIKNNVNNQGYEVNNTPPSYYQASVDLGKINQYCVIINDEDCSNTFFREVVDKLRADGIQCSEAQGCSNINVDNSIVITLDQQYCAGPGTLIIAPFDNTRVGNSDSLALAMHSAFDQNGFLVDDITCGQVGFEEDENGNVSYVVPTATEKAIDKDRNVSFVVISFGTGNQNAEWVAKSIEGGLARHIFYLEKYDAQTDLVYRATESDDIGNVASYFGTDEATLRTYNHFTSEEFHNSDTVVNPYVEEMPVFDKTSEFLIDGEKTKAY